MKEPSYSWEDFKARLHTGWQMECRVAQYLRHWGHDVPDPQWWIRDKDDIAAIERQRNQQDFVVAGTLLEVKSRKLAFGTPKQWRYPYPNAFLETVYGYQRKQRKPDVYVLVSQLTGGLLIADGRGGRHFEVVDRPDHQRKLTEKCYTYPAERLRSHTWLEGFLASRAE